MSDWAVGMLLACMVVTYYHHKSSALAKEVEALKAQLLREGLHPATHRPEASAASAPRPAP